LSAVPRIQEVEISKIVVKKRIRRELGDLGSLMNSLKRYGQLSPVLINPHLVLISGQRRLEAARRLGWSTIKAVVVEKDTSLEMLELEIEENVERRNFTPDELSDGFDALERLKNPGFFRRFFSWLFQAVKRFFSKKRR
jgi:ParB family chromosome partitioning protein